jgi:hypothetical protein
VSGETYRSFLLRLWKPAVGEAVRVAMQDVETGERCAFADLDRFCRWLDREIGATRDPDAEVTPSSDGD